MGQREKGRRREWVARFSELWSNCGLGTATSRVPVLSEGQIWQDGEERVVGVEATFVVCHAVFGGCDVALFPPQIS